MNEKTIGEQLKAAREKKHLSLDDIAATLHIRSSYLQSLEEDKIHELSSQTQARGFIRLYASHLGLDPLELLKDREPATQAPRLEESAAALKEVGVTPTDKIPKTKKKPIRSKITDSSSAKSQVPIQPKIDPYEKILKQIGDELVSRRKKLALSLDEVEKHIHIRKSYLDAIETGKIDDLPSTIQGRGLLSNYAEFLDLDPDPILVRFAEALQSKVKPDQEGFPKPSQTQAKKHHPAWVFIKKYLTLDLVVGGALILTLFFFVFWGAAQLINSNLQQNSEFTPEVAGLIAQTPGSIGTLSNPGATDAGIIPIPSLVTTDNAASEPSPSPAASQNLFGSGSLQVNVVATQSAFVRVVADGRQIFNDRVIGGNAYQFSATNIIELITGNAAALQVTFNGSSLGILGSMGQVVDLIFTSTGIQTATPAFMASTTRTPTNTPTPTQLPTLTSTQPTLTPLVPTSQP